jgi:hypothetical protein
MLKHQLMKPTVLGMWGWVVLKKHASVLEDPAASNLRVPNFKFLRQSWFYNILQHGAFLRIKLVLILNTMIFFFCKIQIIVYIRITIWLLLRKPLPTPNPKLTHILHQGHFQHTSKQGCTIILKRQFSFSFCFFHCN